MSIGTIKQIHIDTLAVITEHPGKIARELSELLNISENPTRARIEVLKAHGLVNRKTARAGRNLVYRYYATGKEAVLAPKPRPRAKPVRRAKSRPLIKMQQKVYINPEWFDPSRYRQPVAREVSA